MTARILIPSIRTNGTGGQYVIEDPDLSKKRVFIEQQAYDIDTLRTRSNEKFFHNDVTNKEPSIPTAGRYQVPYMVTNGKYFYASAFGRTDTEAAVGHCEPWFASLDYDKLPGRHSFVSRSGIIHLAIYYSYSTNTGQQSIWNGYDLNNVANYFSYAQNVNFIGFYEDPFAANQWYGINHNNVASTTEGPKLGKLVLTGAPTTGGPEFKQAGGDRNGVYQNIMFFLGANADASAMFIELNGAHSGLKFHKLTTGNVAYQVLDWVHPGNTSWHYQYPSKLLHTSDRRKVFYQGGWNQHDSTFQLTEEFKEPFFHRFIWDPVTQQVDIKRCTVTYPAGKYHYNYQRTVRYEPSWHSNYYNNWFYRPHVFTVGTQTYLTYMFIDKSTPNYYGERPYYSRRDLNNTWVTFIVGNGENDDQLTYHSTFIWSPARYYVRYVLPINTAGNQLLAFRMDTTETLTFDTDLGWVSHDKEQISMRSVAQDSTGRIYIATSGANNYYDNTSGGYDQSEGKGYNQIWEYIPNSPITLRAVPAQTSYIYSGTPITSSISLTARKSLENALIAQTVKLVIHGTNAQFANGTDTVTVTTSASGAINVPFTILGAGQPSITAHVIL
jgi:hypothetical protein